MSWPRRWRQALSGSTQALRHPPLCAVRRGQELRDRQRVGGRWPGGVHSAASHQYGRLKWGGGPSLDLGRSPTDAVAASYPFETSDPSDAPAARDRRAKPSLTIPWQKPKIVLYFLLLVGQEIRRAWSRRMMGERPRHSHRAWDGEEFFYSKAS